MLEYASMECQRDSASLQVFFQGLHSFGQLDLRL